MTATIGRQLLRLFELEVAPGPAVRRPVATTGFDRAYTSLAVLTVLGIFVDVYSHVMFGPDQTVFSAYHLLFYTSVLALGVLLVLAHRDGQRAGFGWAEALPHGYGQALLGVLLFGVAGGVDLLGHALFGFETGAEAVLSPSHQVLMLCVVLIGLGPLRTMLAGAALSRDRRVDWRGMLVVGPSTVVVLAGLTLLGLLYTPLAGESFAVQDARLDQQDVAISLENAQLYVQTAILFGTLLWLVRQVRLPAGGIAAILLGWASILALMELDALPYLLVGVGALGIELVALLVRPSESELRLRLFGLLGPLPLWLGFYGLAELLGLGGGLWFSGYVWLGAVAHCAGIGGVIALLLTRSSIDHDLDTDVAAVARTGPAPVDERPAARTRGATGVALRAVLAVAAVGASVGLGATQAWATDDADAPAAAVDADREGFVDRLLGSTEESIANRLPVGAFEVDVDGNRLLGDTDLRLHLARTGQQLDREALAGLDVVVVLSPTTREEGTGANDGSSGPDEGVQVDAVAQLVDDTFVTPQLPVTAAGAYDLLVTVTERSGAVHRGTTATWVYTPAIELPAGAQAAAVLAPFALLGVALRRSRSRGRLLVRPAA